LGAQFLNTNGEPFMDKYSPVLKSNTDFHYIVVGMAIETREGRNPFYLDCSPMKPEDIELMMPGSGWQKLNYDRLLELGINFFKDKTEWIPQGRGTYGGIVVDTEGRTKVSGLFATGTTWPTDAGVYMGGWNLCKTATTGYMVGESAGEYAKSSQTFQIDASVVEALKQQVLSPLSKTGISPREVSKAIRDIMSPYDVSILKNENSLKKALDKLESVKDNLLPQMTAQDTHYLMRLNELNGMALTTELYLRASLIRTETRGGHTREDYPNRDNEKWMKWIVFSQQKNKLDVRTEPVPIDSYDVKPTRYYMDNFNFPL
jgi:succinate dehydrogenase/fumarate reductase flavoprotein subunit